MAPHARPSGFPTMGGIFNDSKNATHISCPSSPSHGFPGGVFHHERSSYSLPSTLAARSNDGGASAALIFAIVFPAFFVIVGLLAILHRVIKLRKLAKAKCAARRAHRCGKSSRRSGGSSSHYSHHSSPSSRSLHSTRSTRSPLADRSYARFDDVPIDNPSPAYMARARSHDLDAAPASPVSSFDFFGTGNRAAAREL